MLHSQWIECHLCLNVFHNFSARNLCLGILVDDHRRLDERHNIYNQWIINNGICLHNSFSIDNTCRFDDRSGKYDSGGDNWIGYTAMRPG